MLARKVTWKLQCETRRHRRPGRLPRTQDQRRAKRILVRDVNEAAPTTQVCRNIFHVIEERSMDFPKRPGVVTDSPNRGVV